MSGGGKKGKREKKEVRKKEKRTNETYFGPRGFPWLLSLFFWVGLGCGENNMPVE